jgi:gas vesicle protein
MAIKSLEHHEHAEHLAHAGHGDAAPEGHGHGGGSQRAALLVAVLAAALAVTEQGAKHAEIRVQESSILAADTWSQYQSKSTRATFSKDLASLIDTLEPGSPEVMARRSKLQEQMQRDQQRYENDPKDGKGAIAERAKAFEHEREHSLEETHSYHNGAAGIELGIVLATASAIIGSRLLIWMALGVGVAGIVFAILGYVAPDLGAI